MVQTVSPRRRRPAWPTGVLLVLCVVMVGTTMLLNPGSKSSIFGKQRPELAAASIAPREEQRAVVMKTQTRGLLEFDQDCRTKYLMVQCHRGQFSNRLMCLKAGVLLARALQRVLVMPMFTDVMPVVDVSKYVSLQCLRRNSQAVTFEEFREETCRGVGLGLPVGNRSRAVAEASQQDYSTEGTPSSTTNTPPQGIFIQHEKAGPFCEEGAVLYVEGGYSLSDYRGYDCWNRREDITNARDLGVEVGRCTHVYPANRTDPNRPYSLAEIKQRFGGLPDKVLLFLDLFGVNLLPGGDDLEQTIDEPGQMCGWMPTEAAAAAADAVMQVLIPPAAVFASAGAGGAGPMAFAQGLGLGWGQAESMLYAGAAATAAPAGGGSARAAGGGGSGGLGLATGGSNGVHRNVLSASTPAGPVPASAVQLQERPPPVRLRGSRRYAAVHLRRSDWFYYCGGYRHCFYSMTEAGAWINDTLAGRGLDTLYVSTNADDREKLMLRRAVSGRVLFWEDVLSQLRTWQALGATTTDVASAAVEFVSSGFGAAAESPPGWLQSLPLNDSLMVQMVEKSICMQASFFVSSRGSTFSSQIVDFRNAGLQPPEHDVLVRKFGEHALSEAAAAATAGLSDVARTPAGPPPNGAMAAPPPPPGAFETSVYLCDDTSPSLTDERRLPDVHNPQILVEQLQGLVGSFRRFVVGAWRHMTSSGSSSPPPAAAAQAAAQDAPRARKTTLRDVLLAPWRALVRLVLLIEDGHAMAAANRFVDMYTGGGLAGLVLEGTLQAPPGALADCVVHAVSESRAEALHVSLVDVPEQQQVLLMQELEARGALKQITRIGGENQERGSTFTLLWRGDGLARHSEPALWEELPTFLERVDAYVLAKARVLLGDRRSVLFRQVENTRRLFGFDDPRDGACSPERLKP